MFILGSCKALNLGRPGCCVASWLQSCNILDCACDQLCHSNNNCCSDIVDIGCYLVSSPSTIFISTPTDTIVKTKFLIACHYSYIFIKIISYKFMCKVVAYLVN